MSCRAKLLDSTSNGCPVRSVMWSQCLLVIDLFAIISSRGHDSLKSSIVLFRSRKACQSFIALGSFRHLKIGIITDEQQQLKFLLHTFNYFIIDIQGSFSIDTCLLKSQVVLNHTKKKYDTQIIVCDSNVGKITCFEIP